MRSLPALLIIFFSCLLSRESFAQQELPLDSLIGRADRFFLKENYDSSIAYCQMAIRKLREKHQPEESEFLKVTGAMLTAGNCYVKKGIYTEAHKYFQYSLRQARALRSSADISNALFALNDLHEKISINNIDFPYPSIPVTEEVSMFFPITKVETVSKDSVRVTIRAGYYDGLTDSIKKGGIISKYSEPERPFGLVNAHLRQIGNNYTSAMAVNDTALKIREGDLVELKVRVPITWRKLDVNQALQYAIYFRSNYKQSLFDPRYLYYYTDSLTNGEINQAMKSQIDEIVTLLGEDTATDKQLQQIANKGIFAGDNVMKGMSRVKEEYIRLFMGFVIEYPRKYIGTRFTLSDVYATWIINNTPLAAADVRRFLLEWVGKPESSTFIANLGKDIKEKNLLERWFNEGMQMANADNLDSAANIALLMNDAAIVLKDTVNKGWGSYLRAYTEKKLGNYSNAENLYRLARSEFRASGNKEGMDWAESALKNIDKGRKIELSVQTGHLFPYIMAASPNSKYLATAGNYDKFIKIWDLALGKEVASFTAHSEYITSLQYSPNGRYIVSASEDTTIRIWNAYDYSLIRTIKTKDVQRIVIFSPDSRQLVAGGNDSLVKILDPVSGKLIRSFKKHKAAVTGLAFLPTNSDYLFSCGSDSMIYKWDLTNGDWDHWYKEKGRVLNIIISNDGKYLCSVNTDTSASIWNLQTHRKYFSVRPNYSISGNTDYAFPAFTPDGKYLAFAVTDDTLDLVELSTMKERVYGIKERGKSGLYDLCFTPDGNFLAARLNFGGPLRVFNFSSWDFNNRPTINYKDLKNYSNLPTEVQFSRDDNKLFIVHEGVSSFDLRNGSTQFLYYGALGFANPYIVMNDEKIGMFTDTKWAYLKFYDHVNKEKMLEVSLPDPLEEMSRFELSANNKYVFLGGKNNTVAGFELPSGKILFSKTYEAGIEKGWQTIRYDSIRQRLFLIGSSDKVIVADAFTGRELASLTVRGAFSAEVTPAFIYITGDKSIVYKFDAKTLQLVKQIRVHASGSGCFSTALSYNYKILLVQVADEFVAIDTRTDKVLYHKHDHEYENGVMNISHDNTMLATGGFDGKVNIYELASGKKLATIYTPREKDFLIADEEGNYLAPKNTLEVMGFHYNNGNYGFEQFDSRFNRPDLVLKKLGRADTGLLRTFYAAYQKRLKKLNIREQDLQGELHLPVVRLKDKFALKPATSLSEYELNIECFDPKYPLRSVQVLVNNNPIFGNAGLAIPGAVQNYSVKAKLPLSVGTNQVKVFCTNSKGAVSLAESIEINSTDVTAAPAKTYFFGIAVSNYKDSSMNLQFAAKDVRDLAAMFKGIQKNFESDTLIDQLATKENILALREKLMKTTVNDKVIISVNGHGLLSDSLDFYYGTYDVDFKDPAKRGLKYEDLEALLDGIPARKKLVLIDACHSGALDKEEILASKKKENNTVAKVDDGVVKGIVARGGITESLGSSVDAGSSYEIMQNLFADLSAGNGAVIISAAGGMEYAYESGKWNNGVFTYCIRKGIEEEMADKDGGNDNKEVDVAELKNYVGKKVSELTNGRQKPVSRRENIEFNWVIW